MEHDLTPEAAVERLIDLYRQSTTRLKDCLERYFDTREPPTIEDAAATRDAASSCGSES